MQNIQPYDDTTEHIRSNFSLEQRADILDALIKEGLAGDAAWIKAKVVARELKEDVIAAGLPWGPWVKKHLKFSKRHMDRVIAVVSSAEPQKALVDMRAKNRVAVAKSRAKKASETYVSPTPKEKATAAWNKFFDGRDHLTVQEKNILFDCDRTDKKAGVLNQRLEHYRMYGGFRGDQAEWQAWCKANVRHLDLLTPRTLNAERSTLFDLKPALPVPVVENNEDLVRAGVIDLIDRMAEDERNKFFGALAQRYSEELYFALDPFVMWGLMFGETE